MSKSTGIGDIKVKDNVVEWKIRGIFSYTEKDQSYSSPHFTVSKCEWYINIYPAGKKNYDKWISLYLSNDNSESVGATCIFGIKKSDGTIENQNSNIYWVFNPRKGYGSPEFLKKSDLLKRKSELAPSNDLTIICTLCVCENDTTPKTNSLSNNLLQLFTSQKDSDVTLKVEDESFHAHKLILKARSPVFSNLFEVPMQEKTTGVVVIEDCDPKAFKVFLEYLYSGRVEELSIHAVELYKIAHKYQVEELRGYCIVAIMGNLSLDNICDIAVLADLYEEEGLKLKVQEFFNVNYKDIFSTVHWEKILTRKPLFANELLKKMAAFWSDE